MQYGNQHFWYIGSRLGISIFSMGMGSVLIAVGCLTIYGVNTSRNSFFSNPKNVPYHAAHCGGSGVSHLRSVPSHHIVTESFDEKEAETWREMITDHIVSLSFKVRRCLLEVISAENDTPFVRVVTCVKTHVLASRSAHHQVTKRRRVLDPFQDTAGWAQGHNVISCHAESVTEGPRARLTTRTGSSAPHEAVDELKDLGHDGILANLVFALDKLSEFAALRSENST